MQVDINFPVMARATKKGADEEFRMLVSHFHRADVPEVSKSETETAVPPVVKTAGSNTTVLPELRFYDGRLFRYLGRLNRFDPRPQQFTDLFGDAFSDAALGELDFTYSSNMGFYKRMDRAPLSRPIHHLYQERLCALSMDGSDRRNRTWPKVSPHLGYAESRKVSLKTAMDRVSSVNAADLDEAFAMHRAQADKLLMIDDGMWYETRPPCIEVDTFWNMYNATESTLFMRYRYMPETLGQRPTSIFFPLSEAERARETAERLRERYKMPDLTPIPHKFETIDHPAFDFDTTEDLVHRTGQALLTNVLKHIIQRPDRATGIDDGWIAAITYQYHFADNHILGMKADYSAELSAIVDCFLSMSWNKFTGGLAEMILPQLRKVLPVIVEMMDDMPISVPAIAAFQGPAG
ncbi:hypothetical protein OIU34_21465 [Pararhizobium sp. BT-229]|uniref:hypothetical protein n=1 Tax=Pararhizobium sp. BT-229 TaxID=2986923 RepID=UPI0021F7A03E|nr:hypothetical protein [Pararhizobium sp. BT-229]MCV9964462.1 hypothetical protein [Pararhizobium sp. BT-229]